MKFFNGQAIKVVKNGVLFEGFYSNKNNLREEVVVDSNGRWLKLDETAEVVEIIGRNLREDAQQAVNTLVANLDEKAIDPKQLNSDSGKKDKKALEDLAVSLVGEDAKNNEDAVKEMFDNALLKKQISSTKDSKTNLIKGMSQEDAQRCAKFIESIDDTSGYSSGMDAPQETYNMFTPNELDIRESLRAFYQVDSSKDDVLEYYKILNPSVSNEDAETYVENFLNEEDGVSLDVAGGTDPSDTVDSEMEEYLVSVDNQDQTLQDLYEACCSHFNISNIERFKEQGVVTQKSFNLLKKAIRENKINQVKVTPKRFKEALEKQLQEEKFNDVFNPTDTLNSTLSNFVIPENPNITLANEDLEPVTNDEEFEEWGNNFEQEIEGTDTAELLDIKKVLDYLAKYITDACDKTKDSNDTIDLDYEDSDYTELPEPTVDQLESSIESSKPVVTDEPDTDFDNDDLYESEADNEDSLELY